MGEMVNKGLFIFICILGIMPVIFSCAYGETAGEYFTKGVEYGKKGQPDKAILEFTKAIDLAPKSAHSYYNRGFAYECKKDPDKAIVDYSKAIEINPKYANAYSGRASMYFYKGRYDKSWTDVHTAESLGNKFDQRFIKELKKASGREK